jgi:hypothetical protein
VLPSSTLDMNTKAMVTDCEEFENKAASLTKAGQVNYVVPLSVFVACQVITTDSIHPVVLVNEVTALERDCKYGILQGA